MYKICKMDLRDIDSEYYADVTFCMYNDKDYMDIITISKHSNHDYGIWILDLNLKDTKQVKASKDIPYTLEHMLFRESSHKYTDDGCSTRDDLESILYELLDFSKEAYDLFVRNSLETYLK